jgi:hypothetical protein
LPWPTITTTARHTSAFVHVAAKKLVAQLEHF